MSRENINEIMRQIAEYSRIQEETSAILDGLKDKLKEYMTAEHIDTLTGEEHKATYKEVKSSRIDTTALKKELPDIATRYTMTTSTMRFTFA